MALVTVFPDLTATSLGTVDFDELPELIRGTVATDKLELPLLKLARFGAQLSRKRSLRHNENVRAITGIETDYDAEHIGFDAAVETIRSAGIRALLYTSPSHSDLRPRWRVLCPTSTELDPSCRAGLLDWLDMQFGGRVFGRESWTLSQAFFFGNCERVEVVEGSSIDLLAPAPSKNVNRCGVTAFMTGIEPKPLPAKLKEQLAYSPEVGERSEHLYSVILALIEHGLTDNAIEVVIRRFPDGAGAKYVGRADLDQEIARVRGKGSDATSYQIPLIAQSAVWGSPGASHANRSLRNAINRLKSNCSRYVLNAETYALGRQVAKGWVSSTAVMEAMLNVSDYNGLVRELGADRVRAIIVTALIDGIKNPYPDL